MKRIVLVLLVLMGVLIGLGRAPEAKAGIFAADGEVTYKEYWVDHSQFTGGCTDAGLPEDPNGSWYVEPGALNKCPKLIQLNIPDNFTNALKAEIYLDLWRNHDGQSTRFRVGSSPTVYAPNVGAEWSRTPWVGEIPLSSLQQTTTFTFWEEHGLYHIHDIGVRIYYDDAHPLIPTGSSDVTAPTGQLLTIKSTDDNVEVPAMAGGLLLVNNDELTLKAQVDAGAKYVEFHAYYDGYDDDNDGEFRDWHNIGRNNWFPGGQGAQNHPTGGTINHIGTVVAPAAGGEVTQKWNLKHIINQSGVRFKIRIVDAAGNVREGAGGVTPEFTLARYYPAVYYTIPGFNDAGLHMSGSQPDAVAYTFPLPASYNPLDYSAAYLVGMYWKKPKFAFNGTSASTISEGGIDEWLLAVRTLNKSVLLPGDNSLVYSYSSGIGQFIERPGPMIVLKGNKTFTPDMSGPFVASRSPFPNSVDVDVFTPVTVALGDLGAGVDKNSVIMSVNGKKATPVFGGTSNDLAVTYVPTAPLPANTQIPVTIYACDLLGNCMTSADVFSFTTEPPDLTPPVISNINAATTDTQATITWTTNEPASSQVQYGLTQALEKPSVSASPLVTKHSLVLPSLQTDSTYYFRLTSTDFNNNTAQSAILTFKTKRAPGPIVSDDFSACTLDSSVWSYINPLNDAPLTLTGTGAQIAVPTGAGHDLWRTVLNSPRLMQYVSNQDFDVQVKFDKPLALKTKTIGILVQQDATNYLRIGFQSEGGSISLVVANTVSGNSTVVFTTPVGITAPSYLRVNRTGDIWNIQYSIDGTNWTLATDYVRAMTMTQIGPYVGNTGTDPAHVNVIDYFINQSDPLEVEDPPIQLNVTQVGQGTVTRDPDKASYACDETVTLTATPAPDWAFQGWGGALSGNDLVKTIVMTKSESVTATFTNDTLYAINVNVVSEGDGVGGTVAKSPDANSYLYGTDVTLTATPTPGWSFVGWSGDYTGTEPVAVVPVIGNMDITATFQQDKYTIETLIITEGVGMGGTITVDPVQETYLYGEAVTITVTSEPGWTFAGWEGEGVSGTDSVLHLAMSQDVVAIARLIQNQYDLTIDIVSNGEEGQVGGIVTKDPDQPTYGHGQTVALQATPENGWVFDGWGGELSGNEPAATVEMLADKVITATFTQQHYAVTVTTQGLGHVDVTPVKEYYLYGDIVTLTPVADPGQEFVMWTGDINNTVAPAIVAIEGDLTVEAIFGVDTTPIEISNPNVEVLPGGTTARVTWTTDVPGTTQVDYGEDVDYLGGAIYKEALVTTHEAILTGLLPETFYHYKLTSVDSAGHVVESDDMTFSTSASSGIFSDDFAACTLDSRWRFVNPEGDGELSLRGNQVAITVPEGTQHNLWKDDMAVPRLMQPSNNTDFTVEIKFDSDLEGLIAMQGILIEQDADNFLRFEFHKRLDGVIHVYAAVIENGQAKPRKALVPPPAEVPAPMYMRVVRAGDKWQQFFKLGEEGEWIKNVEFNFTVDVNQVGFYAGNTPSGGSIPAHTAVVDYFFNTAAPISAEDSRYAINVDVVGSGAVTRNPNRGYYCGQQVTLRATPAAGWIFRGWTGDATGSSPVRTVVIAGDMNLTAEFVASNEGYKLVVPIILR